MARTDDVFQFLPERINVGLSSIIGVTVWPGQVSVSLKYFTGGTLEVGGTYAVTAGATVAFTWGKGYVMDTAESLSSNMSGIFYLAATGATVTAMLIRGIQRQD